MGYREPLNDEEWAPTDAPRVRRDCAADVLGSLNYPKTYGAAGKQIAAQERKKSIFIDIGECCAGEIDFRTGPERHLERLRRRNVPF
jgi:hypothetical protein